MRDQLVDTMYSAINEALANMHTATVAKVTGVNATTINCKPVFARMVEGKAVQLPEFLEVPPIFLRGGASHEAWPIAVGDYALLVFTERCFDNWYHGTDNQPPADFRMHDYSDGFALVGISPLSGAITIPAKITRAGDSIFNGNLTVNGSITVVGGDVNADGVGLKTHVHTDPQGGNTGVGH